MTSLYLRGNRIGCVRAILFDKDGTLEYSQPSIEILAHLRIFHCQQFISRKQRQQLNQLLNTAYGLCNGQVMPTSSVAVASRHHNLISTATAFCQVGISWSYAFKQSSIIFGITDLYYSSIGKFINDTTGKIHPLIQALCNQKITCGVVSNDSQQAIWQFLRYHHLDNLMKIVWSANDQPSKPNPNVIHHICDVLKLQPAECVIISDADTDLHMAEQAGMGLTIGYTGGWATTNILNFGSYQFNSWLELEVIEDL